MQRILSGLACACLLTLTHISSATSLSIATVEHDTWPLAVAMIESDLNSAGRVTHVTVTGPDGARVGCNAYELALDAVASQAFVIGACDPASAATEVRLVHREALFDAGDPVPTPRAAGISARQLLTGSVSGGARQSMETELRCSVAIRPFLRDLEHGTRVYFAPGRYAIRSLGTDVFARDNGVGWTLDEPYPNTSRGHRGAVRVHYEIVDTMSGETVLREAASLSCARVPTDAVATEPPIETTPAIADSTNVAVENPPVETPSPDDNANVVIEGGHVGLSGAHVEIHGGSVVIRAGGSLTIERGGSLTIGGR